MSATNKTPNMELPEFLPNDKPAWLVDWNGAMSTIDTYCGNLNQQTVVANANANAAMEKASAVESNVDSIDSQITAINNQISSLDSDLTFTYIAANSNNNSEIKTFNGFSYYSKKLARISIYANTGDINNTFTPEPVKDSTGRQRYIIRYGQIPANIFQFPVGTMTNSAPSSGWGTLGIISAITKSTISTEPALVIPTPAFVHALAFWDGSNTQFFSVGNNSSSNIFQAGFSFTLTNSGTPSLDII